MERFFDKKWEFVKRNKIIKNLFYRFEAFAFPQNLTKLARHYKTDKWGVHYYTPHYQNHFKAFRKKKIKLLEIGVGGNDNPQVGGNSLRMWKRYFKNGKIYSLDLYDKSPLEESRIKIFKGDQSSQEVLDHLLQYTGDLDIIVDDGSHINEHVITSFKILFPYLKSGGIYVIEDTQTSYWPTFGGEFRPTHSQNTTMGFLKSLTDGLNSSEFQFDYDRNYFDRYISSIHFYHNIVFIHKK